jgi:hypothetical protein
MEEKDNKPAKLGLSVWHWDFLFFSPASISVFGPFAEGLQ